MCREQSQRSASRNLEPGYLELRGFVFGALPNGIFRSQVLDIGYASVGYVTK